MLLYGHNMLFIKQAKAKMANKYATGKRSVECVDKKKNYGKKGKLKVHR